MQWLFVCSPILECIHEEQSKACHMSRFHILISLESRENSIFAKFKQAIPNPTFGSLRIFKDCRLIHRQLCTYRCSVKLQSLTSSHTTSMGSCVLRDAFLVACFLEWLQKFYWLLETYFCSDVGRWIWICLLSYRWGPDNITFKLKGPMSTDHVLPVGAQSRCHSNIRIINASRQNASVLMTFSTSLLWFRLKPCGVLQREHCP